jgi:hypothetical protein
MVVPVMGGVPEFNAGLDDEALDVMLCTIVATNGKLDVHDELVVFNGVDMLVDRRGGGLEAKPIDELDDKMLGKLEFKDGLNGELGNELGSKLKLEGKPGDKLVGTVLGVMSDDTLANEVGKGDGVVELGGLIVNMELSVAGGDGLVTLDVGYGDGGNIDGPGTLGINSDSELDNDVVTINVLDSAGDGADDEERVKLMLPGSGGGGCDGADGDEAVTLALLGGGTDGVSSGVDV